MEAAGEKRFSEAAKNLLFRVAGSRLSIEEKMRLAGLLLSSKEADLTPLAAEIDKLIPSR